MNATAVHAEPRVKGPRAGSQPVPAVPRGIRVTGLPTRSTNLERDVQSAQFPELYIGARTQEVIERLVSAMEDAGRTRAWSLTGPYGSGKSTLGLLIDALLAADGPRRTRAMDLLSDANESLGARLLAAGRVHSSEGFLGAIVTARREPLLQTLDRALRVAVDRKWPRRKPNPVKAALTALESSADSASVLATVRALCQHAPLLLVIDEFGKTLEYLAVQDEFTDNADDLYVLQELAELGAGTSGLPVFLFTMQHLSFLDYAARTTALQTREWAKIQGRFEDVTFTTHPVDTLQMLVRSMDRTGLDQAGRALIDDQADAAIRMWPELGLQSVLDADQNLLASLYPLHPLTALAAPLLAAQVGQNDRSLSGFLTADEPYTVHRFLATYSIERPTKASTLKLTHLYDYFLASGRTTVLASANASRWIEIDSRLSEAHGVAAEDMDLLKTVGLLNLIDSSGSLRASADMILFALSDPATAGDPKNRKAVLKRLEALAKKGFLVYREFSDEYRIWQGTDTDIKARIDEILGQCDDTTIASLIASRVPNAVVAGRHSQRTGLLRHFVTTVSVAGTASVTGPSVGEAADGMLVYHLGKVTTTPAASGVLPVVVGTTGIYREVLDAGRGLWALQELMQDPSLDSVARREVSERSLQAAAHLAQVLASAFNPTNDSTRWTLVTPTDSVPKGSVGVAIEARSLAGVVSAACERVFHACPVVHNEMLGRHQLTSQGAKARRELLTAMIEHADAGYLAMSGYGPERAMYSGVLVPLGLHREVLRDERDAEGDVDYRLSAPDRDTSLSPAWAELEKRLSEAEYETPLDEIIASVVAPPFGLKSGIVPVVILAALLLHREDVALFEEGTYIPTITADLVERLAKSPGRFTVTSVPTSHGQRLALLAALSDHLVIAPATAPGVASRARNAALLSVARGLLDQVRVLSPYALRTKNVSGPAIAARAALVGARDPGHLVFTALPEAVGHRPVTSHSATNQKRAATCATAIVEAVAELTGFQQAQREMVVDTIAREFRLPPVLDHLRVEFRTRVRGLEDVLIDPGLKGLVRHVLTEAMNDAEWLDPLITRLCGAGITAWSDAQATHFPQQVKEMARALDRVSYLQQGPGLSHGPDGHISRMVTVTSPDGTEERALVTIPDHLDAEASSLAQACLEQAQEKLGADGARILLASLARTLLSVEEPAQEPTTEDISPSNTDRQAAS